MTTEMPDISNIPDVISHLISLELGKPIQEECDPGKFEELALEEIDNAQNRSPKDRLYFETQMRHILSAMQYQIGGLRNLRDNPVKLRLQFNQLMRDFKSSIERLKDSCESYSQGKATAREQLAATTAKIMQSRLEDFGAFAPKKKETGSLDFSLRWSYSATQDNPRMEALINTPDYPYVHPSEVRRLTYSLQTEAYAAIQKAMVTVCGYPGKTPPYPRLCRLVKACLPESLQLRTALILKSTDDPDHEFSSLYEFQSMAFDRIKARYITDNGQFHDRRSFCEALTLSTALCGPIDLLVIRTSSTPGLNPIFPGGGFTPLACLDQLAPKATVVIESSYAGMNQESGRNMANHIFVQAPEGTTVFAPTDSSYGFTLEGTEFKFFSRWSPGTDITYKIDEESGAYVKAIAFVRQLQEFVTPIMRDFEHPTMNDGEERMPSRNQDNEDSFDPLIDNESPGERLIDMLNASRRDRISS